jgi:hypothetical protein
MYRACCQGKERSVWITPPKAFTTLSVVHCDGGDERMDYNTDNSLMALEAGPPKMVTDGSNR